MRKNRAMTHAIAMLALDGLVGFDLGAPPQVFGAARAEDDTPFYTVTTCGVGGRPVRPERGGFLVTPDHDLGPLATADTVLVPGVSGGSTMIDGKVRPEVTDALQAAHKRGARIISICTGASVLAAAGLLDGRVAASHWAWAKRLRRLYPQVEWDFEVLFVDGGDVPGGVQAANGHPIIVRSAARTDEWPGGHDAQESGHDPYDRDAGARRRGRF